MKSLSPVQLLGLGSLGLGLGLFAYQRARARDLTRDSFGSLFTQAAFNPYAPGAKLLPISLAAVYRVNGQDQIQQLSLPAESSWSIVSIVAQRLASCVLLEPTPIAPTRLWALRVSRGPLPLSNYRRDPNQPLSAWQRLYGRSLGDLDNARPACLRPSFCTQDEPRLAAGSSSCQP
jgi:hypothetical protein